MTSRVAGTRTIRRIWYVALLLRFQPPITEPLHTRLKRRRITTSHLGKWLFTFPRSMFEMRSMHSSRFSLVSWMMCLTLITINPCPGTVSVSTILLLYSYTLFEEWALPDQLVYSTISAILRVCSIHPDQTDLAVKTILRFITQVVQKLPIASREYC